jgi:hypothetical protein
MKRLKRVRVLVFNATFNNISVISWRSVLLVEETGENHRPAASDWQTVSHNVVSSAPRLIGVRTYNDSDNIKFCICMIVYTNVHGSTVIEEKLNAAHF